MVIQVNYFGTKNMIKALIPLMRPSAAGARIVSVTSRLGRLNGKRHVSKNLLFHSLLLSSLLDRCSSSSLFQQFIKLSQSSRSYLRRFFIITLLSQKNMCDRLIRSLNCYGEHLFNCLIIL